MTAPNDEVKVEPWIVVVSDICSSSTILENLHRIGELPRWRNLLINLKDYLRDRTSYRGFVLYKFVGDGWILLFKPSSTDMLIGTLKGLSKRYLKEYENLIDPILETHPPIKGITYGIDTGELIKIKMNDTEEYIGRPLNIASRLQGAIKEGDKKPAGKVLLSNKAYLLLEGHIKEEGYECTRVTRELRNISGGEQFHCRKLNLFSKVKEDT